MLPPFFVYSYYLPDINDDLFSPIYTYADFKNNLSFVSYLFLIGFIYYECTYFFSDYVINFSELISFALSDPTD